MVEITRRPISISNMPAILLGIMMAVLVLFISLGFLGPLKDLVDEMRSADNLNCASASDYNESATSEELTCLAADLIIPAFIILVIISGLAWITIARAKRTPEISV